MTKRYTHTSPPDVTSAQPEKAASASVFLPPLPSTGDDLFDKAARVVFHHEGFYSNDPDDAGGATKYGISLRAARQMGDLDGDGRADMDLDGDGDVDIDDILQLTPEKALLIYRRAYWEPYPYSKLPTPTAIKVFDLAVNMGPKQAHILLQRALRAASGARLVEDGIIGRNTLIAAAAAYQPSLLAAIRSEAAGFYRLLALQNPKSRKYLNGWLNRAYF